uniref:glycosyltransferase n=1 Tax=Flavobacterium sp. TaxID=239 RepID=UPI00404A7A13
MPKLKVAHILHSVGGVDVSLRLILENIDNKKFDNIIIHGKLDTPNSFKNKNGIKLKSYKTSIYRDISFINDIKSIFHAYKILKKEKPNLIHAHSAKGGVIGRFLGYLLNINVLYTPQAFSYLSTQNMIKRMVFLKIEKLLKLKCNFVLASSKSELHRAITEVGYKKDRVLTFENSINSINQVFPLKIEKTWPDIYICTVGRPSYQKNIELMIHVFFELNKTRRVHLVVMGVGHHVGQLDSVKTLIKNLGMEHDVTLLNWTDQSDVFHIIKNSQLYISTARYEGLPYSVIESLALSKPCVVSDCDGNRDLIKHGYNGYVIKDEDIFKYKKYILNLLENKKLYEELSKNAYQTFSDNFDILKNIKNLESIYLKYSKIEKEI